MQKISITDNNKINYFITEFDQLMSLDNNEIVKRYPKLVTFLDEIFPIKTINSKKFISREMGNLIHSVQSLFQMNRKITLENIKTNPNVTWEIYQRIVDILDFVSTEDGFICKIKLTSSILDNCNCEYTFNQNTVAAMFEI